MKDSIFYVLHVKPRSEQKVFKFLEVYGAFRYLPTYVKERRVQRRKVRVTLPLFPGYVFTRLDGENRLKMLKTNLLVQMIEIPDPRRVIHELRQIRRASNLAPLIPAERLFKSGDKVKVCRGAFFGLEGFVSKAEKLLYLNLEILGRSVSVSIDPSDCEKLR